MNERIRVVLPVRSFKDCAFCEWGHLHESGHGYICKNPNSPRYGEHMKHWGNYCNKFALNEREADNE
ncbi:MAG: hypothetical protein ACTSYX_04905 [Candidatus Thorarchaeota archaeon]